MSQEAMAVESTHRDFSKLPIYSGRASLDPMKQVKVINLDDPVGKAEDRRRRLATRS